MHNIFNKYVALSLIVFGLFMPSLSFAQNKAALENTQDMRLPAVTVIKVEEREIVSRVVVSGTVLPREDVLIVPEVEGLIITEILVDEGSRVKKGAVLARLNRSSLENTVAQNKAQLTRIDAVIAQSKSQIIEAEANRQQANNSYSRTASLLKSGSASTDIYDQKQAASKGADARLSSARQALEIGLADRASAQAVLNDTELRLARTDIKAPVDGVIYRRNAKLGAVASANGEPLFRVLKDGLVELEAEVAELDMPQLKLDQAVQVTISGVIDPVEGKIRLMSPEVDKATRLGRVRIALDKERLFSTGSFARGLIETGRKRAISVPLSSITYSKAGAILQSVVQAKIISRPVQIGMVNDVQAEIISGIKVGDMIVARSGSFLRDGDTIRSVMTNGEAAQK
jgi:HlyD family secretion protein